MNRVLIVTFIPLMAATAACLSAEPMATSTSPVSAGTVGECFLLRVGETSQIEGADLSVSFTEVKDDSRCPKDVQCVWAGEATVIFAVHSGGQRGDLTFKVPPGGSATNEFRDYTIKIVELEPQTESDKPIEPGDYVAKVLVEAP